MRNLIEYDHLSIDGRMSGDSWWAGQKDIVPNDSHFAYQPLSGIRTTAMNLTKVTERGNGTVVLTYIPSR